MHYIGSDSKAGRARASVGRSPTVREGLVLILIGALPNGRASARALLSIFQQDHVVGLAATRDCDLFAVRRDGESEDESGLEEG